MRASSSLLLLSRTMLSALSGSLSHGMDTNCPANITVTGTEGVTILVTKAIFTYLYLYPEQSFEGFSIVAVGDGWQERARFMVSSCCPQEATWWYMFAEFAMQRRRNNTCSSYIDFKVKIGDCNLGCRKTGCFTGGPGLQVVAHGHSRWRFKKPKGCELKFENATESLKVNCSETQSLGANTKDMTVVVVSVVVVVGILVTGIYMAMVMRIQQRRETSRRDAMQPCQGAGATSETITLENNLYEPVENTRDGVVMENNLYESFQNTSDGVVVENNLYESFQNTSDGVVVENNLYEPVEDLRNLQPR